MAVKALNMVRGLFVNMATGYTREWIRFFTGCGIPDDVATMYALIFYENRIQKNMLLDLNKEYLRDMGITVMGDVIAILRHAKTVHEKYVREQILSVDDNLIVEPINTTSESSPLVKKNTPMKRMLEHYTRKYSSSDLDSISDVQVILPNNKVTSLPKKIPDKTRIQTSLKKKIEMSAKPTGVKEKRLEVPVPKVRRVLPENEGRYKIKMPSGTTERSKKLLEEAKKRKIKTVFDRLGESSVSSTTSDISIATISSTPSHKNFSVFSRLGEKTSAVSSTSSIDDIEKIPPDQLQYVGILKSGSVVKKNIPNTTMRADEQQKSEDGKLKLNKGISVKNRLGVTKQNQEVKTPNRTTLKAVRLGDRLGKESTTLKLSNKSNFGLKTGVITTKFNYEAENTQKKTTLSTSQIEKIEGKNLKRKLDTSTTSDSNPSKKVRFGRTTHRLIPATPSPVDSFSYVKNYPKLTMIINNKTQANSKLLTGMQTGSLNSDKIKQKVGVKERIGNKSLQGRLGKKIGTPSLGQLGNKKFGRVQDRLG